jgi:phosphatidylglycerol lysyltransferase
VQPVCQDIEQHPGSSAKLVSRPADRQRSLEEVAYRFGQYYDSYLSTDQGRETFWSRDGRGAVAFVRVGRYLNVGGGLLTSARRRESLLAEVIAAAERCGDAVSFYNVTECDLELFRDYGFQATKLGEEATIDLDDWSCRGKTFEWLRRQVNYCRRQRLRVVELEREDFSATQWHAVLAELADVSAAFLAAKPQAGELRFLDGVFEPHTLGRRRIFVARSETGSGRNGGRIEAFLVCNPYRNGAGWAFEIYRRRPDAVRGAIAFLMHEAIQALREEGVRRVSLCLVPGLRAHHSLPGDSLLVRRGLTIGSRYFNFIFDTAGLYHFKSRFRPRFEGRYLCARPAVTLGSAWSLVRLLGVLELDAGKLARVLARRVRRRATLAVPD